MGCNDDRVIDIVNEAIPIYTIVNVNPHTKKIDCHITKHVKMTARQALADKIKALITAYANRAY